MPKALEDYNGICLKIRGNSQVPSYVHEHPKYQSLSQELDSCKRSEKMWRKTFWGLEEQQQQGEQEK
jgi:uncharacterized membrane protein YfbV (UPF0208 family)